MNFELLDEQYPGSRFVLTVRPVDEWIESRRRHVETNVRRQAAGEYTGMFVTVDEDGWREEWDEHVRAVRDYFAGRDDFLEIDLATDPGVAAVVRPARRAVPGGTVPVGES